MDAFSDEEHAYLNRLTGELVTIRQEEIDIVEDGVTIDAAPEWQQEQIRKTREVLDSTDYLALPRKFDIHEYAIMERFCYSLADDELSQELLYQIRGSGAFRRFRDAIHCEGIAQDWYRFRTAALREIGVSRQTVNEVLRERRSVSPEMALRLSRLFGNSPEFWLNAQRAVDSWDAAQAIGPEVKRIKRLTSA